MQECEGVKPGASTNHSPTKSIPSTANYVNEFCKELVGGIDYDISSAPTNVSLNIFFYPLSKL